jgi:hypothetical protein
MFIICIYLNVVPKKMEPIFAGVVAHRGIANNYGQVKYD